MTTCKYTTTNGCSSNPYYFNICFAAQKCLGPYIKVGDYLPPKETNLPHAYTYNPAEPSYISIAKVLEDYDKKFEDMEIRLKMIEVSIEKLVESICG